MTKSPLYKITAWRDNAVRIVLTQGEGSSANNPTYNKKIQFSLYDKFGSLEIPNETNITLAITKPDNTTDLISGSKIDGSDSDIEFDVKNTITTCAGIVKGEIRLITGLSVTKFYGINFNVYDGVNDDGAIQSEQFNALVQALQKVINVTGDGEIATMDSVIEHGGTNPVASGVIYDYLTGNFYTKTESDNKFQTIANKTQTIDSDRQTTTANATQYPSVAAVKDFLYANFMTESEIYDYLDSFYTQAEADDKFALKSNSYTKSEINAIQTENDKRFALHMSVAFDNNGVPVKFVDKINLSAGDFSGDAIKTAFIGSNVQLIQSGAFIGCQNLTDVYVDRKISTITIQDGALPSGATVHYMNGFNYGELIIAAVKYLNSIKANAADVYTKSEVDTAINGIKPFEYQVTLAANQWSNKKQSITVPVQSYVIGDNTRIRFDISNLDSVAENCDIESVTAETKTNNQIEFEFVGETNPTININAILTLQEVNSNGEQ
jgi:hypothetical protein